jgi:hypothetical protein
VPPDEILNYRGVHFEREKKHVDGAHFEENELYEKLEELEDLRNENQKKIKMAN